MLSGIANVGQVRAGSLAFARTGRGFAVCRRMICIVLGYFVEVALDLFFQESQVKCL